MGLRPDLMGSVTPLSRFSSAGKLNDPLFTDSDVALPHKALSVSQVRPYPADTASQGDRNCLTGMATGVCDCFWFFSRWQHRKVRTLLSLIGLKGL